MRKKLWRYDETCLTPCHLKFIVLLIAASKILLQKFPQQRLIQIDIITHYMSSGMSGKHNEKVIWDAINLFLLFRVGCEKTEMCRRRLFSEEKSLICCFRRGYLKNFWRKFICLNRVGEYKHWSFELAGEENLVFFSYVQKIFPSLSIENIWCMKCVKG